MVMKLGLLALASCVDLQLPPCVSGPCTDAATGPEAGTGSSSDAALRDAGASAPDAGGATAEATDASPHGPTDAPEDREFDVAPTERPQDAGADTARPEGRDGNEDCGADPAPDELISDFERGSLATYERGGRRQQEWRLLTDGTAPLALASVRADAPVCSEYAMHLSGPPSTQYGPAVSAAFAGSVDNRPQAYDARAYRGIAFLARVATSETRADIRITDRNTRPEFGICATCLDYFRANLSLTTSWRRYAIPFADLVQAQTGDQFPALDTAGLVSMQFNLWTNRAVDIWIDDIRFFR